jgi:hypothetical protein
MLDFNALQFKAFARETIEAANTGGSAAMPSTATHTVVGLVTVTVPATSEEFNVDVTIALSLLATLYGRPRNHAAKVHEIDQQQQGQQGQYEHRQPEHYDYDYEASGKYVHRHHSSKVAATTMSVPVHHRHSIHHRDIHNTATAQHGEASIQGYESSSRKFHQLSEHETSSTAIAYAKTAIATVEQSRSEKMLFDTSVVSPIFNQASRVHYNTAEYFGGGTPHMMLYHNNASNISIGNNNNTLTEDIRTQEKARRFQSSRDERTHQRISVSHTSRGGGSKGVFFRKSSVNFGTVSTGSLTRVKVELCNATDCEVSWSLISSIV